MVYARNRYYSPGLGRFISQDPIGFAGGLNLYAYCGNDPINFTDPLGLDRVIIAGGCTITDLDHDNSAFNFLNASSNRAKALKPKLKPGEKIHVIVYMPNYKKREKNPRADHEKTNNYSRIMTAKAKQHGFEFVPVDHADDVIGYINKIGKGKLDGMDYFGHSNKDTMMLDYDGTTSDYLNMEDWNKLNPNIFGKGFAMRSYGCSQGMKGGMMEQMAKKWHIPTTGSTTLTDYTKCVGSNWIPGGNYVNYR